MSDIEDLAELLSALGHPNRLALIGLLTQQPRFSSDLAEAAGLSPALTTHHLGILARAGIVERRPIGPWADYHLVPEVPAVAADVLRGWFAPAVPGRPRKRRR